MAGYSYHENNRNNLKENYSRCPHCSGPTMGTVVLEQNNILPVIPCFYTMLATLPQVHMGTVYAIIITYMFDTYTLEEIL